MGRLQKSYSTCMECGGKKMKSGGNWIQGAIKKPGSFTAQANRAGMSVPGFRDKVLANKEDYSSTTVKRANLAKTLAGMKKGQNGMETGPREYETVKFGPYKGRTFLANPISDEERLGRQAELAAMSRARKITPMQRQAMQDSVYTLDQTKNPKIMRGPAPAMGGGQCAPGPSGQNCRNKEAIHKAAAAGYGNQKNGGYIMKGQGGMDFKNPMGADAGVDMGTTAPVKTKPKATADMNVNQSVKAIDPNLDYAKKDMSSLERQAEMENVRRYQKMLNDKYGANLAVDGAWGKNTQKAYEQFVLKKAAPKAAASTSKANSPSTMRPSREDMPASMQKNKPATKTATPKDMTPWKTPAAPRTMEDLFSGQAYLPLPLRTKTTSYSDRLRNANLNKGKNKPTYSSAKALPWNK